jgi:hypothetical protein
MSWLWSFRGKICANPGEGVFNGHMGERINSKLILNLLVKFINV